MFTSKERDAETGLDFFGARYFSSAQGRFTSPDEPLLDQWVRDPQSWNLYAYTRNNPLRFVDPTGNCSQAANGYTDDGKGLFPGPCSGGTIGETPKNNPNSTTVRDFEPPSDLLLAVAHGAQAASPVADVRGVAAFYGASALGGSLLYATGAIDLLATAPEISSVLGPNKAVIYLLRVTNPKLRNIINAIYRTGAKIGDGGTADAVRYTKETGDLVGGSDHIQKAQDLAQGLSNVLKNPNLTQTERSIANSLLNELKDALK